MKENGTKILAVLIAENLSLKKLINNLSTEISKRIGILYKYRRIIKPFLLKQLYFSFINCYLTFIWLIPFMFKCEEKLVPSISHSFLTSKLGNKYYFGSRGKLA